MMPTIDFAIKVIKTFYGDVDVMHVDDSNNCVNVFFKDGFGVIKEYFQAPNRKYMISKI